VSPRCIVIGDVWLANAGDAAIALAMSEALGRALGRVELSFACHHRNLVGDRYPELDLVPPLTTLVGGEGAWTTAADRQERSRLEKLVDGAELVIATGGGYLYEHYRPEARIRVYESLLDAGKRFGFYAQSVGRFTEPALRERMCAVLEAADLVLLRDQASVEAVRELGVSRTLHLTADEAVLLTPPRAVPRSSDLLVCASLHPWARGESVITPAEVLEAIGTALGRALAAGTIRDVTLASTVQGLGGVEWALEDDACAAEQVLAGLATDVRARVRKIDGYVSVREFLALAAAHDRALSTRMHGALLAAIAGTPVVVVNGSDKTRNLALGGFLTVEQPSELDGALAGLAARRDALLEAQRAALSRLRERAAANAELVAELMLSPVSCGRGDARYEIGEPLSDVLERTDRSA